MSERKFQVGDRVRVIDSDREMYGKIGQVQRYETDMPRPYLVESVCGGCDGWFRGDELEFAPVINETQCGFKVGDRVRILAAGSGMFQTIGVVTNIKQCVPLPYHVQAETEQIHSWFRADELEPAPAVNEPKAPQPKFRVGDRVRVRKPKEPNMGWMSPEMDIYDGGVYEIQREWGGAVRFKNCLQWAFRHEWLEPAPAVNECLTVDKPKDSRKFRSMAAFDIGEAVRIKKPDSECDFWHPEMDQFDKIEGRIARIDTDSSEGFFYRVDPIHNWRFFQRDLEAASRPVANRKRFKFGDKVKVLESGHDWHGRICLVASVEEDKGKVWVYESHDTSVSAFVKIDALELIERDAFSKPDNVNHPPHYNQGGIECLEAIKAALGDGFVAYLRGNCIKYLWRCEHKGGIEDLRKAAFYLDRAIKEMEVSSE